MVLKSSTIIGGSGATQRKEMDFYSTPSEATQSLLNFLLAQGVNKEELHVWEPACGSGAISDILISNDIIVHSSDLRNTGYGFHNVDYLSCDRVEHNCIITNPPFFIADKFIKRAVQETSIICMLLKSTYWHAKKRKQLWAKRIPSFVLPLTWRLDFTHGGKGSPTMDMIWTVWMDSKKGICEYIPIDRPKPLMLTGTLFDFPNHL